MHNPSDGKDKRFRSVCVFCGSSPGRDPRYAEAASTLGKLLAAEGYGLVFGGGNIGLMGETARAVRTGGAPVIVWPGGGITFMVDVTRMPTNSFGYVPTPAIVAPIEFTLRLDDYAALGGHVDEVRPLAEVVAQHAERPNTMFASGAVARRAGARRKA